MLAKSVVHIDVSVVQFKWKKYSGNHDAIVAFVEHLGLIIAHTIFHLYGILHLIVSVDDETQSPKYVTSQDVGVYHVTHQGMVQ